MEKIFFSSLVRMLNRRLIQLHSLLSGSQGLMTSLITGLRKSARHSSNNCEVSRVIDFSGQIGKLTRSSGSLVLLVFILSIFPLTSTAQNSNKVVVIPLGGDSLTTEQANVLEFFSYDAANNRLSVKGTAQNPLDEIWFQDVNVRGAGQVVQNSTTNGPDIPFNSTLVEIARDSITLGSDPNNSQAALVHAFANIDSSGGVVCPCEFRGYLWQDKGLTSAVRSLPAHLEVEASDNDIDATISHTFAFIATALTQDYSFEVQLFAQQGTPGNNLYKVDEAGITISTFGLGGAGTLNVSGGGLTSADLMPEAALPE